MFRENIIPCQRKNGKKQSYTNGKLFPTITGMNMESLRQLIRETRQRLGMSQEKLALLSNVSLRTINNFEKGRFDLQGASLVSVLDVLGFSILPPTKGATAAVPPPSVRGVEEQLDEVRRLAEDARRIAEAALLLAARKGGEEAPGPNVDTEAGED